MKHKLQISIFKKQYRKSKKFFFISNCFIYYKNFINVPVQFIGVVSKSTCQMEKAAKTTSIQRQRGS